jgi:hypothetical protein
VLVRHGLSRLGDADQVTTAPIRSVACHPGALLHQDHKKLGRIPDGGGWRALGRGGGTKRGHGRIGYDHLEVVIDDTSRYAVVVPVPDESGGAAVAALETAALEFARLGIRIERVLTDNGSAYRSSTYRTAVDGLGARHKRTRPFRPQTNGKDVHLCQAASSARSGLNSVLALSIAQRTRSFVRARAMIAWWWDLPSARLRS